MTALRRQSRSLSSFIFATFLATSLGSALLLSACAGSVEEERGPEHQVRAAFEQYRDAVLRTDSEAVASLFAADATVVHGDAQPVVGRDNIRKLLETFAGYKAVPYDVDIRTATALPDSVLLTGRYRQVMTRNGETLQERGAFRALWKQQADGHWVIENMRTTAAAKPAAAS